MNYDIERATDLRSWKPSRPAEFSAGVGLVFEPSSLRTCSSYRLSWTMTPSVEVAASSYVAIRFPLHVDVAQASSSSLNGLSIDNVNKRIVGTTKRNYILGIQFELVVEGVRMGHEETELSTTVESYTSEKCEEGEMVHQSKTKAYQVTANTLTKTEAVDLTSGSSTIGEIGGYTVTLEGSCGDISKPRIHIVAPSAFAANVQTCGETPGCALDLPFTTVVPDKALAAGSMLAVGCKLVNPPSEKPVSGEFEIAVYDGSTGAKAFTVVATLKDKVSFSAGVFSSFEIATENTKAAEYSSYSFSVGVKHEVPLNGYFLITLNENIGLLAGASVYLNGIKATYTASAHSIKVKTSSNIQANAVVAITVEKLMNPVLMGSYSEIAVTSMDTESHRIDTSTFASIQVTEPGVAQLAVNVENPVNLAESVYELTFTSPNFEMPYEEKNYLHIELPSELKSCGQLIAISSSLSPYTDGTYRFTVAGTPTKSLKFSLLCTNPGVTTPTSDFVVTLRSSSAAPILVGRSPVQTTTGSALASHSLSCSTKCPRCSSACTASFVRTNAAAIRIIVLRSASLNPAYDWCSAVMPVNPSSSCSYDADSGALIVIFATSTTADSFTIRDMSVINPDYDTKEGSKFSLKTYSTAGINANYLVDQSDHMGTLPVLCNYPCLECEIDSPSTCTSCTKDVYSGSFYFLYADLKECQLLSESENCRTGYYKDTANYKCVKCDPSCVACINFATYCTECPSSTYAYQGNCEATCPDGTYTNKEKGACYECFEGCLKCSNSATYCSACKDNYFYYNNACYERCPDKTFSSGRTCEPCNSECLTCSASANACTSCSSNRYLLGTSCVAKEECTKDNERVADENNECTLCTPPCSHCLNTVDKCLKCVSNSFLYESQCLRSCPDGYYGKDGECLSCASPCATCSGTANTCGSCIGGMFLLSDKYVCAASCTSEYYVSGRTCILCESPCKACSSSATTCSSCVDSYYLFEDKCVAKCPSNSFLELGKCTLCDSSCLTCHTTSKTCASCASDAFLNVNTCVATCPQGKFGDEGVCRQCNVECSACSGAAGFCLGCTKGKFAHGGACLDSCPSGTVADESKSACVGCGAGCDVCRRDGADESLVCAKCAGEYKYLEGKCYYVCPSEYVTSSDGLECVKAHVKSGSGEYLPFPHLIAGGLLGILAAVGQSRDGRALIVSNLIVVLNYATISSYILQIVWAVLESAVFVTSITSVVLLLQVALNLTFVLVFARKTEEDSTFQAWATAHSCTRKLLLGFSGVFTLQTCRFFYSRFMGFAVFFVRFTNFGNILWTLNGFSMLQIILVHCVAIVTDVVGLCRLERGTKLYVNVIESLVLSLILVVLLCYEMRSTQSIKNEIENESTKYAQLRDSSTVPSLKPVDEERIRKDILESIFKEIGISSHTSIKTESEADDLLSSLPTKFKKTRRPRRRGSFSNAADARKEKDPKASRSYPCSPKTAQKREMASLTVSEVDPAKLPDNVYSEAAPPKETGKGKKVVEFGVQTPPFQKLEMFRKHIGNQSKRTKKGRKLFEPDHAPRPLEVIQEDFEDNDELINEERKRSVKPSVMERSDEAEVQGSELKGIIVIDEPNAPLKDSKVHPSLNSKQSRNPEGTPKVMMSFPIRGSSMGDRDNSKGLSRRPSSPPQSCEDQKESINNPLRFYEESKQDAAKDKKTLITPNKLPAAFEDNDGYKFSSAKLKDSLAKNNEGKSEVRELWVNDDEIMGVFEKDPDDGCILIMENNEGVLLDARGRRVNKYGYLVNEEGNIVNQEGKFVMTKKEFEKELEDEDVQPPQLLANNLFREIAPNQQSFGAGDSEGVKVNTGEQIYCEDIESEARKSASLDSLMDDTPSNYNLQNQRYADPLAAAQKKGTFVNKLPQYATRGAELTLNESREKCQQSNKSAAKAANERAFDDVNRKHSFDIAMEEPSATRVKFNNVEATAEAQGKPRTAKSKLRRAKADMTRARSRRKEDELDRAYNLNVKAMAEEDCVSVVSAAPSAISRASNCDAKLRGLESIYLQRLESSSKHNKKIEEQSRRKRKVKTHKAEKGNQENGLAHDEISSLLADNYKTMELNFGKAPADHVQTIARTGKKP